MVDLRDLPGGRDLGAERDGDTVVRAARPWTESVHRLLGHLAAKGFAGSPRPVGIEGPQERLTYLAGQVIGTRRPWPPFVHSDGALVGLVDWAMAGPRSVEDDVARVAFSWVPLHARSVVTAEGFREFGLLWDRLQMFLDAYGWEGRAAEVLKILDRVLEQQIDTMRTLAAAGDPAYQRMLKLRRHEDLEAARSEARAEGAHR